MEGKSDSISQYVSERTGTNRQRNSVIVSATHPCWYFSRSLPILDINMSYISGEESYVLKIGIIVVEKGFVIEVIFSSPPKLRTNITL